MQNATKSLRYLVATAILIGWLSAPCRASVTITPSTVHFDTETVGLTTPTHLLTLFNSGNTPITVTSFSLSDPQFKLCQGLEPFTVSGHSMTHYTLEFAPTSAGSFTATFTVNIKNQNPIVVTLLGTGVTTGAIASVSPTSIAFGSITEGTMSAAQTVTVTD